MSTQPSSDDAPNTEGAFHWQPSDAALLQPNMLAIPKVQRAWERKPLAPFSKQRLRVGKVWKRSAAAVPANASDAIAIEGSNRGSKRRKSRNSLSGPLKPVKKMRVESSFGMGARVLQWEGSESPTRKIVTRSNPSNQEMLALPDEEEDEVEVDGDADVTVEILDEDGTVLDVGGEELEQDQAWEDDEPSNKPPETEFDGTMMHLAEIIDAAKKEPQLLSIADPQCGLDMENSGAESDDSTTKLDSTNINFEADDIGLTAEDLDVGVPAFELPDQITTTRGKSEDFSSLAIGSDPIMAESNALPEGFVSPVKQNPPPPPPRRYKRASFGGRRRTLPMQFAPTPLRNVMAAYEDDDEEPTANTTAGIEASPSKDTVVATEQGVDAQSDQDDQGGQDWEDVDEVTSASASSDGEDMDHDATQFQWDGDYHTSSLQEATDTDADDELPIEMYIDLSAQPLVAQDADAIARASSKLPSSPVPTIEGQHPRLPLRRSPRRKSSSPMKKSTIMPSTESSHLVAFTPVKLPAQYPSPSSHPGQLDPFAESDENQPEPGSPLERASSAPPEEPQMSPQKPSKPRISDDTALLQAFLNRAAESKSSRRVSTTSRESLTNRRDSDAVRQALASPAKADVLADLDPNSPSPRKPAATVRLDENVGMDESMADSKKVVLQDEDIDDSKPATRTRSGRGTRTSAQASMPAGPNRIAIRGNTDGVVLKRSEAQEMALLTRNNTRKNKGGAVLPPIKLGRLNSQSNPDTEAGLEGEDVTQAEKPKNGKKGVKWSETLVEFYQGGEISETSILSDELHAPEQNAQAESEAGVAAPPPPSETPSKPKIRRLKPTRTAATPGKAPPAPIAEPDKPATEEPTAKETEQPKAVPTTKRRSRIATPAKGLAKTSLLPADLDPQPVVPVPATAADKKPAPKKKAPSSKLPAPPSTSTSTSTSLALGQGKENLISSPPKKRAPPPPSAKSFAPKLDLGKKLEPPSATEEQAPPGLMSPAKKGGAGRKGSTSSVFGNAPVLDFGNGKDKDGAALGGGEVLGLSSPAKKRTRRAVP